MSNKLANFMFSKKQFENLLRTGYGFNKFALNNENLKCAVFLQAESIFIQFYYEDNILPKSLPDAVCCREVKI